MELHIASFPLWRSVGLRTVVGLQVPCACTTKARPSYDNTLRSRAEKPFSHTVQGRFAQEFLSQLLTQKKR